MSCKWVRFVVLLWFFDSYLVWFLVEFSSFLHQASMMRANQLQHRLGWVKYHHSLAWELWLGHIATHIKFLGFVSQWTKWRSLVRFYLGLLWVEWWFGTMRWVCCCELIPAAWAGLPLAPVREWGFVGQPTTFGFRQATQWVFEPFLPSLRFPSPASLKRPGFQFWPGQSLPCTPCQPESINF